MLVSTISLPPSILSPSIQKTQQPPIQAVADNDGDADDHGGPPDNDGVKKALLDIKA